MFKLISVTNRNLATRPFHQQLRLLVGAGIDAIVLREKDLPEDEYSQLAQKALDLCHGTWTTCILHTFAGVAERLGAAALHLPLPVLRELPPDRRAQFTTLGASCHSLADALEAAQLGCTYITLGHIFATDCKKGLPPRGLQLLQDVCATSPIPVYAIGGIQPNNLAAVQAAGAAGACLMSSLMKADSPKQLMEELKSAL